ncbi:MAG: PIN domain-containing protein [Hyphomicrobiales bacterium]|nr:PIN domain-containing protein [Hyphomicrobiales bacterium]
MSAKPFFDTNVLVYAFASNDPRSGKAEALLAEGGLVSVQVLNEFVNVARRKQRREWDEIRSALDALKVLLEPPLPLTVDVHEAAIEIARHRGFAFYDSLIVAAAAIAGCRVLFTEDLQDGQSIGELTIRNPFSQ